MSDEPRTVGSTATLQMRRDPADRIPPPPKPVRAVVVHYGYQCEFGWECCCGHAVKFNGKTTYHRGEHPEEAKSEEDFRAFAEQLANIGVRQELGKFYVADLDWDNSDVVTHDGGGA